MLFSEHTIKDDHANANPDALQMIADLARENGQLQAENAELKKEIARLGSARIVSAEAAAG